MQIFAMVHFSGKKIATAFIKIVKESGTQEKIKSHVCGQSPNMCSPCLTLQNSWFREGEG